MTVAIPASIAIGNEKSLNPCQFVTSETLFKIITTTPALTKATIASMLLTLETYGTDRVMSKAINKEDEKTVTKPPATFSFLLLENLSKDRKSTRLNSSHVAISYAVFCLKKK